MTIIPNTEFDSWWDEWLKILKDDGRFDEHLPRLTTMVYSRQCVGFSEDCAFVLMSPMRGNRLFIDFVYSLKPNAIVRLLPALQRVIREGGYEGAETIAHGKAQARLYRRYFEETETGFYINVKT